MFDIIYKKLYVLGLYSQRYTARFLKWLLKIIKKPIKALGAVLYAAFLLVDVFVLKSIKAVFDELKELNADVKSVSSNIHTTFRCDKKQGIKILNHYTRKAFNKHGVVFSFATNIITPVLALALLYFTINYWSSKNLALQITYNNTVIGYVSSESVYQEAKDKANERLETANAANEGGSLIKPAQYTIKNTSFSDLKDSQAVCDELIEKSESNITNACGIYIDGNFLCAVKNETDATTVFDNLISNYQTDDANAVVSFVENISYVQGLYPDNVNTIWDADKLQGKLASKKSEAVYYNVQQGDTVSGIAQKFGISTAKVFSLNPSLVEKIHIGQQILISSEVNFIRVQVTKTEVRNVEIGYTSEKIQTPSLYKGKTKTIQKGSNGVQQVTELVTYIDGVRVSSKEVARVTLKDPVTEKIQVGTKGYSSGSYSGSYSSGPVTSYGGRFIWPAIGAYNISSPFGGARHHGGIDIVKPGGNSTGCTVVAAGSGRVVSAGYHPSWGYNIVIDHGNGLSTRYAHMLKGSLKVSPGQSVSAGQPIGNIGSTGNVTGPHLHFEVMVNGNRVNPLAYLGR